MLIVTAYYDIPSKQPASFYYEHMRRFFEYIDAPVLFFTDARNYEKLKPLAQNNVTFKIQEFEDMMIFKSFPIELWKDRLSRDPEKYHTWQLGALWSNKPGFVRQAAEVFPEHMWYMWVDVGCVRTDGWKDTLRAFGKRPAPSIPGVYLQLLNKLPSSRRYFSFPDIFIAGSHCLFHKDFIHPFLDGFYKVLSEYDARGNSLTMDQYILATMTYDYSFIIPLTQQCATIDMWFFFFSAF